MEHIALSESTVKKYPFISHAHEKLKDETKNNMIKVNTPLLPNLQSLLQFGAYT